MRLPAAAEVLRDDATHVARQAAVLFAISGASALAEMVSEPDRTGVLATLVVANLLIAAVVWVLPWRRWPRHLTLVLALVAFAMLAVSPVVYDHFSAGTELFFVLVFVWLGLHQPRWALATAVVPATIAYSVPLLYVHADHEAVMSAVLLIPIAYGIGLLISSQVRRLREHLNRAERAEQWRSALTATLAHDIRTPLTTVQATLQMLTEMDELAAADRERLLDAALRQTMRLSRLSAGLLDVERVEQGQLRLDRRQLSVSATIESAVAQLAPAGEMQVEVEPGLEVYADPERLEQILVNLIANAARHGRPPIVISAHAEERTVVLEVRDHGDGVPAGRVPRLFVRLGGDARHPDSVGLGMWIVRLLTEAHGGSVRYEPAEPGARFVVTLPASPLPLARDVDSDLGSGTSVS